MTSRTPRNLAGNPSSQQNGSHEELEPWVVDTSSEFERLLGVLASMPLYCFDTEFHRERTYYARLALLQVAWPGGIAIVDPLKVDVSGFASVLEGKGLAIVHACDQDLEIMQRVCGAVPSSILDTQVAAGFLGMSSPSLSALTERLLGVRLEKGDQLTDWTRRPLSAGQLRYAANDVAYLIELYEALRDRLEAAGRWEWAVTECQPLLAAARRTSDPDEAWWKLRQARQLRGAQRGVAQSITAWRERRARRLDLPVRQVLPDLPLASIAHRPPKSREELSQVRGLDGRYLSDGAAAEILEAVAAGERLPASSIRLPPSIPEDASRPMLALAVAYGAERARQLGIDASILATRADVTAFLRDPPEGRLVTSWRGEILGEPIRRLVSGEAALVLEDSSLVLEQRSRIPFSAADLSLNEPADEPMEGVDRPLPSSELGDASS